MTKFMLEKIIQRARKAYYAGEPEMSDVQYDKLIERLQALAPNSLTLKRIGAPVTGSVAAHSIPMGSLKKASSFDVFAAWWRGITRGVIVTRKLDGASVSIDYQDGKLVQALTRGDGIEGEVITDNVRRMRYVPAELPGFTGSLRGEIVMRKNIFHSEYADKYANPRNTAVGFSRRHSGEGCEDLTVVMFKAVGQGFKTRAGMFGFLQGHKDLNCVIPDLCHDIDEVKVVFEQWAADRVDYPFETDGIVISINRYSDRDPGDSMWPDDEIVLKFDADTAQTKVRSITWEAGRTGRVNPVIHVEPIKLAGVTVTKATGNNLEWMAVKRIGVGAEVLVSRRGDVIPAVEEVVTFGRKVVPPVNCPACDMPLEQDGAYLKCSNMQCTAKTTSAILHWLDLVSVKGLGDAGVDLLVQKWVLRDAASLYHHSRNSYIHVLGKNGGKFYDRLSAVKEVPLEKIFAACVPNVGTRRFRKLIAAGFDQPEKLFLMKRSDIIGLEGFKRKTASAVVEGIAEAKEAIERLLVYIGVAKEKTMKKGKQKMAGVGIKFTGKMEKDRATMEAIAVQHGAQIGWKKGLRNLLVIADPNSSSTKAQAARKAGYELISPEGFLSALE